MTDACPAACPDPVTLGKLLLGDLPAPRRELLADHFLHCGRCVALAETLPVDDELTAAIQDVRVTESESTAISQVIERGKLLAERIPATGTRATLSYETVRPARAAGQATPPSQSGEGAEPGVERKVPGKLAGEDWTQLLRSSEHPGELGWLGPYRVLEVIGVGGMGVVFRAEDPKLERQIALKAMQPLVAASRSARERFLREARATAAVEHDHIVPIYQVGEADGVPFIAMPLLRGETLRSRLQREQKLSPLELVNLGRQIASGLAAAHARGLIHRDIKPENVWIEAKTGRVRILDFGLVHLADATSGLTHNGIVLGTPRYMAPEQALGRAVDPRSDLFSFGSLLYTLAAGRPPFDGASALEIVTAVVGKDPLPLTKLRPEMDGELSCLISQLLAKESAQRPQSAAEVAERLAAIQRRLKDPGKAPPNTNEPPIRIEIRTERQAPRSRGSRHSRHSRTPRGSRERNTRMLWIGGALLGAIAALAAVTSTLRVATPVGTLVVQVSDDDFRTSVQGQKITLRNVKTKRTYTIILDRTEKKKGLPPGEYTFLLTTDSGLRTRVTEFTIHRDKPHRVKVWWETGDASADGGQATARDEPLLAARPPVAERSYEHAAKNFFETRFAVLSPDASTVAFRMDDSPLKMILRENDVSLAAPPMMLDALSLAYAADGETLATGHGDGKIRLWQADSLEPIDQPFTAPAAPQVHWVALSRNGKLLLAMASERTYKVKHEADFLVWDTATRRLVSRFVAETSLLAVGTKVAASVDGQRLVVAGKQSTTLWNTLTGTQIPVKLAVPADRQANLNVQLSPDGTRVAYGMLSGAGSYLAVLDAATGQELWRSGKQRGRVYAVRFSSSGKFLVSSVAGSEAARLHLWDAQQGRELARWEQTPQRGGKWSSAVEFLSFSGTESHLLTAGQGVPVTVWRLRLR